GSSTVHDSIVGHKITAVRVPAAGARGGSGMPMAKPAGAGSTRCTGRRLSGFGLDGGWLTRSAGPSVGGRDECVDGLRGRGGDLVVGERGTGAVGAGRRRRSGRRGVPARLFGHAWPARR